jgi:hypothetical protein
MPRTQCRNRHVPDGLSPRTGTGWAAQAPNAGRVRPSTGARCGKAARRDLRGGREVTPAPTATSGAGCTPGCCFPGRRSAAECGLAVFRYIEPSDASRPSGALSGRSGMCPRLSPRCRSRHPDDRPWRCARRTRTGRRWSAGRSIASRVHGHRRRSSGRSGPERSVVRGVAAARAVVPASSSILQPVDQAEDRLAGKVG